MAEISLPEKCLIFLERLRSSVRESIAECDCALLSGGIDTTFVASMHPHPENLKALTVVVPSGSSDEYYSRLAAKRLGIGRHIVVKLEGSLLEEALDWVLSSLKTIDPVEVAADIVHYASLKTSLLESCSCVASGDGGDELFLGYSFLYNKSDEELRSWIRRMAEKAWLPTIWVGERLGVRVVVPLYSWEARRIALEAPLECLLDRRRGMGKLLLRKHLYDIGLWEIAVRPKTPVTGGSGSLSMLKTIAARTRVEALSGLDFKPPSPLHAYLANRMKERGIPFPPKCGEPRRCPICGRCLDGNGYCRFCGAIATGKGVSFHYTG